MPAGRREDPLWKSTSFCGLSNIPRPRGKHRLARLLFASSPSHRLYIMFLDLYHVNAQCSTSHCLFPVVHVLIQRKPPPTTVTGLDPVNETLTCHLASWLTFLLYVQSSADLLLRTLQTCSYYNRVEIIHYLYIVHRVEMSHYWYKALFYNKQVQHEPILATLLLVAGRKTGSGPHSAGP